MRTRWAEHLISSITKRLDGLSLALTPSLARLSSSRPVFRLPSDSNQVISFFDSDKAPKPGPSHTSRSQSTAPGPSKPCLRTKPVKRTRLIPLNPSRPLLPLVGLDNEHSTNPASFQSPSADLQRKARLDQLERVSNRSRALSRLLTALDHGIPKEVFDAFIQVPYDFPLSPSSQQGPPMRMSITIHEMKRILKVLSTDTPRFHEGLARLTAVVEEIKRRRNYIMATLQHPPKLSMTTHRERLAEFSRWDSLIDRPTINSLIAFTGRCLRNISLNELNDALSIRASMYTEIKGKQSSKTDLHLDRETYNILLSIVCQTVHPYLKKLPEDPHSWHMPSQPSHPSHFKLPFYIAKLGVESDQGHYTARVADKIFQALLHEMRMQEGLDPDSSTFNIMINMYSRLEKWDRVASTVQSMQQAKLLDTPAVNLILWKWGRKEPTILPTGVDPVQEVQRIYQSMRSNLLALERRMLSKSSGDEKDANQFGQSEAEQDARNRFLYDRRNAFGLESILSADSLPAHIIPDKVTYSLLTKLYTFRGDFAGALSTFKDMVSTPEVKLVLSKDKKSYEIRSDLYEKEVLMKPSIAFYDSFFKGFAKHGVGSDLIKFNKDDPIKSLWKPIKSNGGHASRSAWNVNTFIEIFKGFMQLQPELAVRGPQQSLNQKMTGKRSVLSKDSKYYKEIGKITDGLSGKGKEREEDNRQLRTTALWILSAEDEDEDGLNYRAGLNRNGPSSNQLFFLLTAIRRVSGDNAQWSLAMWDQVVTKFSDPIWSGLRMNNRLSRVEEYLENKLNNQNQS